MRNFLRFLTEFEIWFVSLLVIASLLFEALLPVTVLLAAVFWLIRWGATGRLTRRTPADLPVLILILLIPVGLWATAVPETTRTQLYRLLTGIAIFYAVINWARTSERLRLICAGVVLAGLALAGFALVSVEWGPSKLAFIPDSIYLLFPPRIADPNNPNVIAGTLVLVLPIIVAVFLSSWPSYSWETRLFAFLAGLFVTAVLVLTQSRGAWLACLAAMIVLAILRWRWGWIVLAVAALSVGVVLYLFGTVPLLEIVMAGTSAGSLEERLGVWSRAALIVRNTPFTGTGMGSFGAVADKLYPFSLTESGKIPHAHNLLLQIAVDMGIPGLVSWLAVLCAGLVAAWMVYASGRASNSRSYWISGMGAGLLGSQIGLIVHGMTDAVTWGMVRPAPLVWALWGVALAFWIEVIPSKRGYSRVSRE